MRMEMDRQRSLFSRQRSKRDDYDRFRQHEDLRSIEYNDHGYSRGIDPRLLQQEDITDEYPRTSDTRSSMTWVTSRNARPNESFVRDYSAADVVISDQPFSQSNSFQRRRYSDSPCYSSYHPAVEDVVLDQPFALSSLPQRRSDYINSSYSSRDYHTDKDVIVDRSFSQSNYSRRRGWRSSGISSYNNAGRDSTKYKSYDEARNQRNFKRNNDRKYHAKSWKDIKQVESSPNLQSRFISKRSFKKPMTNSLKLGGQRENQVKKTVSSKSEELSIKPKGPTPVSNSNSAKISETKCMKDNEEGDFANKPVATKPSEDNAEAKSTKKLETRSYKNKTEANPKKKLLPAISSKDKTEANLEKNLLHAESSEDKAEDNLTTKIEKVSSSKLDHKEVDCEKGDDTTTSKGHASSSNLNDSKMKDLNGKCYSRQDASSCYFRLMKDNKIICRTKCTNPPIQPSSSWDVDIVRRTTVKGLYDLPQFFLFPAFHESHQKREESEWVKFLTYLCESNKVAIVEFDNLKIYVFPPETTNSSKTDGGLYFHHAVVAYKLQELCDTSVDQRCGQLVVHGAVINKISATPIVRSVLEDEVKKSSGPHSIPPDPCMINARAFESEAYVKGSSSTEKGACSSISKCHEAANSILPFSAKEDVLTERNFVSADPSYLKTLGQAHSGWIFGAIAELVDNSRDAGASRIEILIENIYDKTVDCDIPMLSIIDDGVGMNHQEILRMISLGHKQPDEDNLDRIGRFGVGFKTGSMRLGRDALVLTQTTHSRSVAFLSQSLNEGKDNLEIPVVSYRRHAQCMEIDKSVQSEALAQHNLNAMKEFSPFNEYLIGEKAGLFGGNTGTQIYIWNLDKWGSNYTLEWQAGMRGGSSFHQGDITIRSRRVRTRPGQTSRKVLLDYQLRPYLEVIFLEPRMKIFVQGSLVKSRPLAKSLNNTAVINGEIMGKQVQLTLGRCQVEWDEANSGIFLYWHGRLIEAYKRVGGMVHSADMGRGVIGVIDITDLMDDGNGGVWVHSNKQGFQDCEAYAELEDWLGKKADEYWDKYFDPVQLKKGNALYKPDYEWVQCDKCRKWRMLNASFDSMKLPKEWFCYMEPFNGRCEMLEQKPGRGVITVGLKRSAHDPSRAADCKEGVHTDNDSAESEDNSQDKHTELAEDDVRPVLKRLRRGPGRVSRKL
ncbi:uncharacterized protein LOC104895755 isoform X2 [Beta vulgaris subsp. vulgaris]|uniref:uncharacterized protein LOC104895755 isoform X2 n=1 Tax=Beta vulgaris subsp. vulgaris TaxID=3555 RepID=UPI0025486470|nr:uncharacterized protein LOC104895755 isoform X2 [Beta vulgaris subsp. vulgaris]